MFLLPSKTIPGGQCWSWDSCLMTTLQNNEQLGQHGSPYLECRL